MSSATTSGLVSEGPHPPPSNPSHRLLLPPSLRKHCQLLQAGQSRSVGGPAFLCSSEDRRGKFHFPVLSLTASHRNLFI